VSAIARDLENDLRDAEAAVAAADDAGDLEQRLRARRRRVVILAARHLPRSAAGFGVVVALNAWLRDYEERVGAAALDTLAGLLTARQNTHEHRSDDA
jgi:hypothetical protein